MKIHEFIRRNGEWFIVLPEYILFGGNEADLQMVAGADNLLDLYADKRDTVTLALDTVQFENADMLQLDQICTPAEGGGAFYKAISLNNESANQVIWICDVLKFVFGHVPSIIYMKKVAHRSDY